MKNLVSRRFLTLLSILVFFFATACASFAQQQSDGFTKALDNLARDISQSSNNVLAGGSGADIDKLSDEVFSRLEGVSLNEIRSFIDTVNTPMQLEYVLESASAFATKNQKLPYVLASLKTIKLLNEKTKFLITQSPEQEELLAVSRKASEAVRKLSSQKNVMARSEVESISKNVTVKSGAPAKSPARSAAKLKQGANYYADTNTTTFAISAPRATSVKLTLFDTADAKTGKEYEMKKTAEGVWYLAFNQKLTGKFYGYHIDGPAGKGERFNPKTLLSDPYAYANDGSYGKSIVVDNAFSWTSNFSTPDVKDIVVYEMHIKSYSAHSSSGVPADKRGKYLGLLEGASSEKVLDRKSVV